MLADLLPLFALAAVLLIPVALIARMAIKRGEYCGEGYRACFWCNKNCTFHALDKVEDT